MSEPKDSSENQPGTITDLTVTTEDAEQGKDSPDASPALDDLEPEGEVRGGVLPAPQGVRGF